jgi:DNA-binding CsgD family transcriptional regulator
MPITCSICRDRDNRGTIERSIAAGDSNASIAKAFNLTAASVAAHRGHIRIDPAHMTKTELAEHRRALLAIDVSSRAHRLQIVSTNLARLEALITARQAAASKRLAESKANPDISPPPPGADTGLLDHRGSTDSATLSSIRTLLEYAARETGHLDNPGDSAGSGPSITIVQGYSQRPMAVLDDSGPDALPGAQSPLEIPLIRRLEATLEQHSSQSVTGDEQPGFLIERPE